MLERSVAEGDGAPSELEKSKKKKFKNNLFTVKEFQESVTEIGPKATDQI